MTVRTIRWIALTTAMALAPAPLVAGDGAPVRIRAAALPLIHVVDDRFMSFQIGFSHLTGGETWKAYDAMPAGGATSGGFAAVRERRLPTDLADPRLRGLTRALAPLYIRYSGTTANSAAFDAAAGAGTTPPPAGFTVTLTAAAWKGAVDFANAVDGRIVTSFANSDGVQDPVRGWTPRMAAPWLDHMRAIGGTIYAAELFNEPNAPEPPRITRGHTPAEFGRDYAAFADFMRRTAPEVKLAGPGNAMMGVPIASIDGFSPEQYASARPTPHFDIVSYHFYPALAERCAPATSPAGIAADRALSEDWLARPDAQIARFRALRDRHAPGAPIWITETGGAACGGLKWQPAFLDTFRFADTHARSARQGIDAIFTHALLSGSNGIIDERTLQPNASYWVAVLWRRLMDRRVLDAGPVRPGFHLYAHCLRGTPGGVTLLAINLVDTPAKVRVAGPAVTYALTAPTMDSRTVLLNGRPLATGPAGALPAMRPIETRGGQITTPPHSISFITLPRSGNPACRD